MLKPRLNSLLPLLVLALVMGCGERVTSQSEDRWDDEAIDARLERYDAGLALTFAAGPPPPFLDSPVLGRLTREADRHDRVSSYWYTTTKDVGEFKDATIVIHPQLGVRFDAAAMLKEAEPRFVALAADPIRIIKSAPEQLLELYRRYYPDQTDISAENLTTGLNLTHIKVVCGPVDDWTYDEMIFYGNENYLSFDLKVATDHDARVILMYFDG